MRRSLFVIFLGLVSIFVCSCNSTETQAPTIEQPKLNFTPTIPSTLSPTKSQTPTLLPTETSTQIPSPTPTAKPESNFRVYPGYKQEWFHKVVLEPRSGCAGPNGEALINGRQFERKYTIYEIGENFELIQHASFPEIGMKILSFQYDTQGNLWFLTETGTLYKMPQGGEPEIIINSIHPGKSWVHSYIQISKSDYIYMIEINGDRILRLTPELNLETYIDGFTDLGGVLALGPNGDIVVHDMGTGELIWVNPEREKQTLFDGATLNDQYSAVFLPDGKLLVRILYKGIFQINLETGDKERIEWLDTLGSYGSFYVIEPSTLIAYDQFYITEFDLNNQSMETIFLPQGNTHALGISPNGKLYAAYGNNFRENGTTWLFRKDEEQDMELIGTLPGGNAAALEFGPDGKAYIITSENRSIWLYSFDPETGIFTELLKSPPVDLGTSLAIDPNTGDLWWGRIDGEGIGRLYTFSEGNVKEIAMLPEGTVKFFPEIGPDGTLYAGVVFTEISAGDLPRKVLRLESDYSWTELFDMSTNIIGDGGNYPTVCSDGSLYVLGDIKVEYLIKNHDWTAPHSPESVIKIFPDGSFEVIAYGTTDGADLECDRLTDDLYVLSSEGIYRVSKSK